ncbi:MAG TPA: polymorphic toxin type 44 domain-containing protein [Thermoanaerobaculia bacterium]|nr:polymorphic toxin type 44 domain-containing protein [Thermoanaerobaculia bacterium]
MSVTLNDRGGGRVEQHARIPISSMAGMMACSGLASIAEGARPEWKMTNSARVQGGFCVTQVAMDATDTAMLAAELKYLARGSPFPISVTAGAKQDERIVRVRVRSARAMGLTQNVSVRVRAPQIVSATGGDAFRWLRGSEVRWQFPPRGRHEVSAVARLVDDVTTAATKDILVPPLPPGEDYVDNICEAMRYAATHKDYGDRGRWFKRQVTDPKLWNYKKWDPNTRLFEGGGNFNYGATGPALGFWLQVLHYYAGVQQLKDGNWEPGFGKPLFAGVRWGEVYPFPWFCTKTCGDEPMDYEQITRGVDFYNSLDQDKLRKRCGVQ